MYWWVTEDSSLRLVRLANLRVPNPLAYQSVEEEEYHKSYTGFLNLTRDLQTVFRKTNKHVQQYNIVQKQTMYCAIFYIQIQP